LTAGFVTAQSAIDEDSPWPRVRSTNGNTVTLNLPQVETWTSNSFRARAVVGVKPAGAKKESLGVIWFEAHGSVDRTNRVVTLDGMEITKGRFPEATDNGSNALALVRELFPGGARTVSLDYLITALGFAQAEARRGTQGLKHTPPEIIWSTNRVVLILVDGEPVLRPIADSALERVVNTPALMVRDKASNKFFLSGSSQWFTADSITGPWSLLQSAPAEVAALSPPPTNAPPMRTDQPAPKIIVSTTPAELLMSDALPDFKPIRGTALQYAADSDSQLFFDTKSREAYLLLSGRWFKASTLRGPWTYVAPHDLPADFAKIPPGSPQAVVLASVPGTPQAELAMVANSVPTTATVNRRDAKIELKYDGEPKFKPIEGTTMSYAINAQLPVIQLGTNYYAVDDAVWFVAASPTGPWEVATEVPEEIYTIPPSSPVYYATFVRVYDADEEKVETGYTPGYTGSYEDDETTVYGTGYEYEPWYGDDYYGWGWTWGYSYWYVPWYGWWVWNPWWNDRGGLRAAIIDNVYDRWQSGNGVTPHDRVAGAARASLRQAYSGYPAQYGRFQGTTRAGQWRPPASTLALNPYSRPQSPARAGELPRGAQLLSSVRQTPGGGRDLYASPDGNVYQRRNDGWYRRQAAGKWDFYAPTQGQVERGQIGSAAGARAAGAGGANRIASAPNASAARGQGRGNRVPNAGGEVRAQEVAALERQHYARALGQARAQNSRAGGNFSRPARSGGGRRR
jgi:hypothetical protein